MESSLAVGAAFEFLLRGYGRKDVVQVPRVLASLLGARWCFFTKRGGSEREVTDLGGTNVFLGSQHGRKNRLLIEERRDTALAFTTSFAIFAGHAAARHCSVLVLMLLTGKTALAASVYKFCRFLAARNRCVYIKADIDIGARTRFGAMRRGSLFGRLRLLLLEYWLATVVDILSVESQVDMDWLGTHLPRLRRKCILVRNCARNSGLPRVKSAHSRSEQMLMVGRLTDPQKGLDILLPALRAFHEVYSNWKLVLVGSGGAELDVLLAPYADLLEKGVICYQGFIEDDAKLQHLYATSSIFVLPSRREGSPLSVLEAIDSGCIPVCTRAFEVDELLGDYVGVLTAEVGDTSSLFDALCRVAKQKEAWPKIIEGLQNQTSELRWDQQLSPVARKIREKFTAMDQGKKAL